MTYTYGGTFDGGSCGITTTCFAPEGTVTTTEPLPLTSQQSQLTSQQSQSTSQSPPRTYLLTALLAVVIALVALAGSLAMARRRRPRRGRRRIRYRSGHPRSRRARAVRRSLKQPAFVM